MKRDLKIVYMGTPEFAVEGLKILIEKGYDVVGVVTAEDKPAGRGRRMHESAVKVFAMQQGLPILQPGKLRNEHFLQALRSLNANLFVVVAFRMLPDVVWRMPDYGTFNLHASLLPQYRGAAPINWVIINGEESTGVTTFFIDEKIDTGAILLQKSIDIKSGETAGSLHDKLMTLGGQLILDTVKLIENDDANPVAQPQHDDLKTAPKIFREDCRIDWSDSVERIVQKIRGLSPYPGAWTIFKNGDEETEVKLYMAFSEIRDIDLMPGAIIKSKNSLSVVAGNGLIHLEELKFAGKRKMDIKSLINGIHFRDECKML